MFIVWVLFFFFICLFVFPLTIIINLYGKMDMTICVFGGCETSLFMVYGSSHGSPTGGRCGERKKTKTNYKSWIDMETLQNKHLSFNSLWCDSEKNFWSEEGGQRNSLHMIHSQCEPSSKGGEIDIDSNSSFYSECGCSNLIRNQALITEYFEFLATM